MSAVVYDSWWAARIAEAEGQAQAAEAELKRLRKGIAEIMAGLVSGEVGGEDVVWFSTIETLWEFCASLLDPEAEFDLECADAAQILARLASSKMKQKIEVTSTGSAS